MADFRLVHLSDFHVGLKPDVLGGLDVRVRSLHPRGTANPLRASSWNQGLGESVRDFVQRNHRQRPLDAVLVSGDLATTGHKGDLVRALEYIEGLVKATAWTTGPDSHLDVGIRRVILFPGNHDRFRRGLFWPGGKRFDTLFMGYWRGPVQTTVLAAGKEHLAIIQADFSLQKRRDANWLSLEYLGQGRVYDSILDRLKRETQRFGEVYAVVWAVHFPPAFEPLDDALRLQNQMNLLYAARDLGVNYIFAGHTHVPRCYQALGVTVCCAGTATQLVVPAGSQGGVNSIHPCTITVNGRRVTKVDWQLWGWNPHFQGFQPRDPAGPPSDGWVL